MAEAKTQTQAQHLTNLDFDISQIFITLQKVQDELKKVVLDIKNGNDYKLELNFDTKSIENLNSVNQKLKQDSATLTSNLKKQATAIDDVTNANERLAQTTITVNQAGEQLQRTDKYILDNLDERIEKIQTNIKGEEVYTETSVSNAEKRRIASEKEQKQIEALQKQKEKELSQSIERSNVENENRYYAEQEKLIKANSSALKKQWEDRVKYETEYENLVNKGLNQQETQLKAVTEQVEKQIRLLANQPSYIDNTIVTDEANKRLQDLNVLMQQVRSGDLLSDEQVQAVQTASKQTKILTEDIRLRIQQEKELTDAIQKQNLQIQQMESYPQSKQNIKTLEDMQSNLANLKNLQEQLSKQNILNPQQQTDLKEYTASVARLNTEMKSANTGTQNMLKTITDKARWLSAFYLITAIEDAFRNMLSSIVEVEEAVVELQRVLSEDIGTIALQDGLTRIAQEYGRTFQEVSETAVKFAQTGAEWNEVLALTESTMLAVNTAELEVTSATTGLIAVISQFNLEAEDMENVIDKINITADNFAVTSEKIVSALQRSGSAAMSANISLEETIGIITALSEATGRSGENIGTALNSLVAYTSKATSLDIFRNYVPEIVAEYESGAKSILDVWEALSTTVESLSGEAQANFARALEGDVAYQDFVTDLETNASDVVESLGEIYGTAGTYRKNYLIALLGDMETVTEATQNMAQAEGYSLAENEKAMSTLTRQYQILVEKLRELAIQFGNEGFLDFLKILVNLGIATIDFVDDLGGLIPVLTAIVTLFLTMKKVNLASVFIAINSAISTGINRFATYASSIATAEGAINKTKVAMAGLNGVLGVFGIGLTLFSLFNAKIQEQNRLLEENKQKYEELHKEYNNATEELGKYINTLDNLYKRRDTADSEELLSINAEIVELQEQINTIIGEQADNLDLVNDKQDATLNKLNDEYFRRLEIKAVNLENQKILAETEANQKAYDPTFWQNFFGEGLDINKQISVAQNKFFNVLTLEEIALMETAEEQIISLEGLLEMLLNKQSEVNKIIAEGGKINTNLPDDYTDAIVFITTILDDYNAKQNKAVEVTNELNSSLAEVSLFKNFGLNLIDTQEEFDVLVDKIENLNEQELSNLGLDELGLSLDLIKELLIKVASEYTNLGIVAEEINSTLTFSEEQVLENMKNLNTEIDNAHSAYTDLVDVMDWYNQGNALNAEMIQKLLNLDAEYLRILKFENGQLTLNGEISGQLIKTKQDLYKALLAEQTAVRVNEAVTRLYNEQLAESQRKTGAVVESQETILDSLTKVASGWILAGNSAKEAYDAYMGYGEDVGLNDEYQLKLQEELNAIFAYNKEIINGINASLSNVSGWVEQKESAEDASEAVKNYWENILSLEQQRLDFAEASGASDEQKIAHLKEIQRLTHLYAEDLRALGASEEEILKLSTDWWNTQEEILDIYREQIDVQKELQEEIYEGRIDDLERQKELLENQLELDTKATEERIEGWESAKDAVSEYYDKQIDGLNEVQEENERIRARNEYLDNLADAKADLASAEARSGVEYREQEEEARQSMSDITEDWKQQLEDWSLEDQISEFERLEEAELDALETQITNAESALEKLSSAVENSISSLDGQIDQIGTTIDKLNEEFTKNAESSNEAFLNDYLQQMKEKNSQLNQENYDSFVQSFAYPTMEAMILNFELAQQANIDTTKFTSEEMATIFGNNLINPLHSGMLGIYDGLLEATDSITKQMLEMYRTNFYDKVNAMNSSIAISNNSGSASQNSGANTAYNTDNRSVTVLANIDNNGRSNSVASKAITDLFDFKKKPY